MCNLQTLPPMDLIFSSHYLGGYINFTTLG